VHTGALDPVTGLLTLAIPDTNRMPINFVFSPGPRISAVLGKKKPLIYIATLEHCHLRTGNNYHDSSCFLLYSHRLSLVCSRMRVISELGYYNKL